MGTCDLPDMYTRCPRACGPRATGVHIRQTTRAHVTTIKYIPTESLCCIEQTPLPELETPKHHQIYLTYYMPLRVFRVYRVYELYIMFCALVKIRHTLFLFGLKLYLTAGSNL